MVSAARCELVGVKVLELFGPSSGGKSTLARRLCAYRGSELRFALVQDRLLERLGLGWLPEGLPRKLLIDGPGDGAGVVHPADAAIFGPIREELKYRAALDATAPGFSDFASAGAFAFAHYNAGEAPEVSRLRVADAFVGGLIYAKAFRDFGLVGAVAAQRSPQRRGDERNFDPENSTCDQDSSEETVSATGGKKRKVRLKPGSCAVIKGFKTFDGERWQHHDYEVCMTKSGLTSRRIGTLPDDDKEPTT